MSKAEQLFKKQAQELAGHNFQKEYLKKKGIDYGLLGVNDATSEDKQKYLSDKYRGGGYKTAQLSNQVARVDSTYVKKQGITPLYKPGIDFSNPQKTYEDRFGKTTRTETSPPVKTSVTPNKTTSNKSGKNNFSTAFSDARKQGLKEFDYNGKKYNTKLKGEKDFKYVNENLPNKTQSLVRNDKKSTPVTVTGTNKSTPIIAKGIDQPTSLKGKFEMQKVKVPGPGENKTAQVLDKAEVVFNKQGFVTANIFGPPKNKKEYNSFKGYMKELGNRLVSDVVGGVVGATMGGVLGGLAGLALKSPTKGAAAGAVLGTLPGMITSDYKSIRESELGAGISPARLTGPGQYIVRLVGNSLGSAVVPLVGGPVADYGISRELFKKEASIKTRAGELFMKLFKKNPVRLKGAEILKGTENITAAQVKNMTPSTELVKFERNLPVKSEIVPATQKVTSGPVTEIPAKQKITEPYNNISDANYTNIDNKAEKTFGQMANKYYKKGKKFVKKYPTQSVVGAGTLGYIAHGDNNQ